MFRLSLHYPWALTIVILLHAVGFVGWHSEWTSLFSILTPLHLLISFGLLVHFTDGSASMKMRLIGVYLLGLVIELLGVHTGLPFGEYVYLEGLGSKILDVPWMIGVNWAILALATGHWVHGYLPEYNRWQRASVAAGLMVLVDLLIEPVAPQLDLWEFASGPGWMNSVGWFVTSFLMQLLLEEGLSRKNRLALPILLSQAIFFAGFHLWPAA